MIRTTFTFISGAYTSIGSNRLRYYALITILALNAYIISISYADHLNSPPLHWAQSAWLGAGIYEVDQTEVFHVAIPSAIPLYTQKDMSYQLSTGLSLGLAGFRLLLLTPPERFSTLSFAPGLQVTYRLSDRWQLKPFIHGGLGMAFSDQTESVYLMSVGMKSIYHFSLGGLKTLIGNRLLFAMHHDREWSRDKLALFSSGIDVRLPFYLSLFDTPRDISLFAIHTLFTPQVSSMNENISWTVKLGFHLGRVSPKKFKLRGGLYYVMGDERLRGVRINLGFPF